FHDVNRDRAPCCGMRVEVGELFKQATDVGVQAATFEKDGSHGSILSCASSFQLPASSFQLPASSSQLPASRSCRLTFASLQFPGRSRRLTRPLDGIALILVVYTHITCFTIANISATVPVLAAEQPEKGRDSGGLKDGSRSLGSHS